MLCQMNQINKSLCKLSDAFIFNLPSTYKTKSFTFANLQMLNPPPPKLNYAKGRQKSKTKNEPQSQQKIVFEGESSTDIFAHLNQDNLNYIKKELKHKKSHQHERGKSTQQIKIDQTSREQKQIQTQKSLKQQKMYQKYKNDDQVTQRDSRQEQTLRETSFNDSIVSEMQSHKPKENPPSKTKQTISKIQKQPQEKDKQTYMGLEPPPLTFTKYKQSIPSTESQNIKQSTLSVQIHGMQKLQRKQKSISKNPFHDYELKSDTSNNPIGNSTVSVQNQISQDLSVHAKPSQFIDHLQSYIEELNLTPQRVHKMSFKQIQDQPSLQQNQSVQKDFRKNKLLSRDQGQRAEQAINSHRSQLNRPYHPISMNSNPKYSEAEKPQFFCNTNRYESNIPKHTIKNSKSPYQKQVFESLNNNSSVFEDLQKELHKERYFCTKLALQLEKYKENQENYQKQISVLNKTIGILKLQMENVKLVYQQESQQTKKILAYIQMQQNQEDKKKRKAVQSDFEYQNQEKMYKRQNWMRFQPQQNHQNFHDYKCSRFYKNEFDQIMKFSRAEPAYSQLNPKLFGRLLEEFNKGQQTYLKESRKRNPLSSVNSPYDFTRQSRKNQKSFEESSHAQYLINNLYKARNPLNDEEDLQNQHFSKEKIRDPSQRKKQSMKDDNEMLQMFQKHTYRNSSLKNHNNDSLQSSSSNQSRTKKEKNSLQKLKQEYEKFKTQIQNSKPQHKKFKSANITQQLTPKQFSHIFVK